MERPPPIRDVKHPTLLGGDGDPSDSGGGAAAAAPLVPVEPQGFATRRDLLRHLTSMAEAGMASSRSQPELHADADTQTVGRHSPSIPWKGREPGSSSRVGRRDRPDERPPHPKRPRWGRTAAEGNCASLSADSSQQSGETAAAPMASFSDQLMAGSGGEGCTPTLAAAEWFGAPAPRGQDGQDAIDAAALHHGQASAAAGRVPQRRRAAQEDWTAGDRKRRHLGGLTRPPEQSE